MADNSLYQELETLKTATDSSSAENSRPKSLSQYASIVIRSLVIEGRRINTVQLVKTIMKAADSFQFPSHIAYWMITSLLIEEGIDNDSDYSITPTILTEYKEVGKYSMSQRCKWTCLMHAANAGNERVVELLVKHGADPYAVDARGMTAAMLAIRKGHKSVVDTLIDNKVEMNMCDGKLGRTALMHALYTEPENESTTCTTSCDHVARDKSKTDIALRLIDYGVDLNVTNKQGRTSLMLACQQGLERVVGTILCYGGKLHAVDRFGRTALVFACEGNHYGTVNILKSYGIEKIVNKIDSFGKSSLMYACSKGDVRIVQTLLDIGANVNEMSTDGKTALMFAALNGYNSLIDLLVKYGASVNVVKEVEPHWGWQRIRTRTRTKKTDSALMVATKGRKVETVRLLLKHGALIDQRNISSNNMTCLMHACSKGSINVVKVLLDHDPDLGSKDQSKMTALKFSCQKFNQVIARLLFEKHLSVDKEIILSNSNIFWTDLMTYACHEGKSSFAKLLIEYGSGVDGLHSSCGRTYLMSACKEGQFEIAKLLFEKVCGLKKHCTSNTSESTFLMSVCTGINLERKDYTALISLLIENGENVDLRNSDGNTALMLACMTGYIDVALFLINEFKPDLRLVNKDCVSLLMIACSFGLNKVIEVVLEQVDDGLDLLINARDCKGKTALMYACASNNQHAVQLLINHSVDMHQVDKNKCNALFYALDNQILLEMLLDQGLDINSVDNTGCTLFLQACKDKTLDIIQWLVGNGANIHVGDNLGSTALMYSSCRYDLIVSKRRPSGRVRDYTAGVAITNWLLKEGVDFNKQDTKGRTALIAAFECEFINSRYTGTGCYNTIVLLLKQGVDVNIKTKEEEFTALFYACRSNNAVFVDMLIGYGADVNLKCSKGMTPMMYAVSCCTRNQRIFESLLDAGADINSVCKAGRTTLSFAADKRFYHIVKVLLSCGKLELDNGKLKATHSSDVISFSRKKFLLIAVDTHTFNWDLCRREKLTKFVHHAIRLGINPGGIYLLNGDYRSPLLMAFIESDEMTFRLIVQNLYYLPMDYKVLHSLHPTSIYNSKIVRDFRTQPLSLMTWGFLRVSEVISTNISPLSRSEIVDSLPLPTAMKPILMFKSQYD